MKRFEFLTSVAVALGLGKLFPSLLSPQAFEPYTVEWDVSPSDIEATTMTVSYWDEDHWVSIGTVPANKRELTGLLPMGFNGPTKMHITLSASIRG